MPEREISLPRTNICGVSPPALATGDVSVCTVLLEDASGGGASETDQIAPEHWRILSNDEQERAAQFLLDRDRRRFAHCRIALRRIVGAYLDMPPQSLQFGYAGLGKPFVLSPRQPKLHFNVSHSHERALIAVSHDVEMGVDIEYLARRTRSVLALANRYFSTSERGEIEAAPVARRRQLFFRCWTRKEAFLKATGTGLTFPLDQFSVSLAAQGDQLLRSIQNDPRRASCWSLLHLDIEPGYLAALAAEHSIAQVHKWRLSS